MYAVIDNAGGILRKFSNWTDADNFRNIRNRPDWNIKDDN